MNGESQDEFLADLNRLQQEAGGPSLRQIESLTKNKVIYCPRSSAADLLAGKRRVRSASLIGFVKACEWHAEKLGIPLAAKRVDIASWQIRYQQLAGFDASAPEASTPRGRTADQSTADEPRPAPDGYLPPPRRPVVLPPRDSRYMIFANGQFDHLPSLPGAHEQAVGLTHALMRTAPWLAVELDLDRNQREVEESVRRVSRDVRGLLVLHFSTHGVLSDHGSLLLTFRDSGDGVPGMLIDRVLGEVGDREQPTVVVIDTCYAGSAHVARLPRGPMGLWTVCGENEAANQHDNLTVALTRTLREGSGADQELLTFNAVNHLITADRSINGSPYSGAPRLATVGGIGDVVLAVNSAHVKSFSEQ